MLPAVAAVRGHFCVRYLTSGAISMTEAALVSMDASARAKHPGMSSVTRENLHAEVWAEPMTKVAERYGVSSNYLARICERLSIPRPSRGYWQQLAAGRTPSVPPLPEPDPDLKCYVGTGLDSTMAHRSYFLVGRAVCDFRRRGACPRVVVFP